MAEVKMRGERITLTAHDGHALAGYHYAPTGTPKASIVFGPAMAVPQSFYAPFAQHLAVEGYAVWTFDYRGTGESLAGRSMRGVKADLSDSDARSATRPMPLAKRRVIRFAVLR